MQGVTNFEQRSSRASFFGRFADDLTRLTVVSPSFEVSVKGSRRRPLYKEDGHFVFAGLVSPGPYEFEATAHQYQNKTFSGYLPANSTVELAFPGEDELIVVVTAIDGARQRVSFDAIPFVRPIREGAAVLGPGPFSAALAEDLEGENVDFAILHGVAGLNNGDVLRIVRSSRMILRPGPYYPFPDRTTLLALRLVENTPGSEPIAGVDIQVIQANTQSVSTIVAGGINLSVVDLPGPVRVMLGPAEAVIARTNARGEAIFYYPGTSPVNSLTTRFTKAGYVTTTLTTALTPQQRTQRTVALARV